MLLALLFSLMTFNNTIRPVVPAAGLHEDWNGLAACPPKLAEPEGTERAKAGNGYSHPKVALCIMATGKYIDYAHQFIASARTYFCTSCNATYFIFTDQPCQEAADIVRIEQKRLGWPYDTLMRFAVYAKAAPLLEQCDYIFASDADMLFVAPVDREILGERVGTQHPGFVGKRGSYETDYRSTACVKNNEGSYYFAGGFYGGNREEFFKLVTSCSCAIDQDLAQDFIACWHDESHLNRYFVDNPPTHVLSPSYCYPESWNLPYTRRLLALDKNHKDMRA